MASARLAAVLLTACCTTATVLSATSCHVGQRRRLRAVQEERLTDGGRGAVVNQRDGDQRRKLQSVLTDEEMDRLTGIFNGTDSSSSASTPAYSTGLGYSRWDSGTSSRTTGSASSSSGSPGTTGGNTGGSAAGESVIPQTPEQGIGQGGEESLAPRSEPDPQAMLRAHDPAIVRMLI
ncbi:unnamed protein product [Vitrella brassicaformis CCMP3155]|uniref:RxLR effector protein n=1 Tax=Vitrella brassicaformis (strain CCMP3155) TaxID=1169540 RepID=A0A0G4G5F5_VITBC|nr:unnamed protein product [Vitrella brassicaformis CCMP3155]|eukprot:CEM23780.1 unnamed protein product [Vitrella brassicaformis CCMP3155]